MVSLVWLWLLLTLVAKVTESADTLKSPWITPNGASTNIEKHLLGYNYHIEWKGWSSSQIKSHMNKSSAADLYVAAWNTNYSYFNKSISTVTIDISKKGWLNWTIEIDEEALSNTTEYSFVFIPSETSFNDRLKTMKYISSPRFRVQSKSITTTTTSSKPTASATTPTTVASSETTGLSTGAKAGIGIGVSIGGLAMLAALGFYIFRRRNRQSPQEMDSTPASGYHQESKTGPDGLLKTQAPSDGQHQKAKPGPHELFALPAELATTQNGR